MSGFDVARVRATIRKFPRALRPRRVLAVLLCAAATALALRPPSPAEPLLVATRVLAPGTALTAADVRVLRAPPDLRPEFALGDPLDAIGRVPAAAIGPGEPITRLRLVGAENTTATAGSGAAAVAIRLADPDVAGLLRPGVRVDVISADPGGRAAVLARDAAVVTVRPGRPGEPGNLVVLALPRESATMVASAALAGPVAVTLR
ncbi:SAF domain-containing protein [Actinokineospora enzanensis]|uniref:SAF domain-containing protein n=1 Tax=Actinokineospora enzanensis TaxID=155975 RepID=UPI000370F81E|nr:SAF domain-containing protein [Actinokineospora enzanensis]